MSFYHLFAILSSESYIYIFERLDGSQQQDAAKALGKVARNPLPANEGGYGKPLGTHAVANLAGLLKIRLKRSGIRIVYKLVRSNNVMLIVVIGLRSDSTVYKTAAYRAAKPDVNKHTRE